MQPNKPVDLTSYLRELERDMSSKAAAKPALPAKRSTAAPRWYVVRTNIKCEERAKLGIEALGFPVFMPIETRRAIRRRRKVDVNSPLFGRYLFVEFDVVADEWPEIKTVDGVEAIVSNNNRPVPIRAHVIDALRLGERLGVFDYRKKPLAGGAKVEVVNGPLGDLIGRFVKARSAERVDILLNLLGSERIVTVSLRDLRAAD